MAAGSDQSGAYYVSSSKSTDENVDFSLSSSSSSSLHVDRKIVFHQFSGLDGAPFPLVFMFLFFIFLFSFLDENQRQALCFVCRH